MCFFRMVDSVKHGTDDLGTFPNILIDENHQLHHV